MAVYAWRGINSAGKEVKGVGDADNPKALRASLRRDGVMVTLVKQEAQAKLDEQRNIDLGRMFRRVTGTDIALTTRQLATLLKSGIPLVEALDALIEQIDKPELGSALTNTRDKVNEGQGFADSLKEHPKLFSHIYTNMVAAGEASGSLDAVLQRLADVLEAQNRLNKKVSGAMAYPAVMVGVTVILVTFLMTVVVPKLAAIFEDFGQVLPWYTRLLMFISDMFTDYWWLMIAMLVGGVLGFRRWKATEEGTKKWDIFLLSLPVFGKLILIVALARFARTLATLLRSGVPLLNALEITRNVLGNTELSRVVENAAEAIREGESIAKPLAASGRFPPIVTHMIAVGERSGELEAMLENVANAYDDQVDAQVQAMTSLLEPIMILVMGVMVGGITMAILMPLMQMNEFVTGS